MSYEEADFSNSYNDHAAHLAAKEILKPSRDIEAKTWRAFRRRDAAMARKVWRAKRNAIRRSSEVKLYGVSPASIAWSTGLDRLLDEKKDQHA